MKKLTIGILAHVDAGKTTLSESMLYHAGQIRTPGRVDHGNAFLDTDAQEKKRGITIFSKQARFTYKDLGVCLLDTPGHVDFSAEMERTLQVLDYAVLVINGMDGVQSHTRTVWSLLKRHRVPVFIFVNKMDQRGTDRDTILIQLQKKLDMACIPFDGSMDRTQWEEELAVTDEAVLEAYMETGVLEKETVRELIAGRKVFPCYFGSALKMTGTGQFMDGMAEWMQEKSYPDEFGARVFKITRDSQNQRLTHLKVTGGSLKVKSMLGEEKINQLRFYNGARFETGETAYAGEICAVTGLNETYIGQGFGVEYVDGQMSLEPVMEYRIVLPDGCDVHTAYQKFSELMEEDPQLFMTWNEKLQEIHVKLMGEVQTEILQNRIRERFGMDVVFDRGRIVYKETIKNVVEGVGHFEPLKHYAEVHLIMEPLERGMGMQYNVRCSADELAPHWQKLILTHLAEREHPGVLTGAAITDMRITVAAGRAHPKHTEGGDFRQATYRAVRQGLMQAESMLLEPYYAFRLEVPQETVGRAMTDIQKMCGVCELSDAGDSEEGFALLTGSVPVVCMQGYQSEVNAYTGGLGKLSCSLKGYGECHNEEEVREEIGYDSGADTDNPSGSVFCSHGAGIYVDWDEVPNYMHVGSCLKTASPYGGEKKEGGLPENLRPPKQKNDMYGSWESDKELEQIFERTFGKVSPRHPAGNGNLGYENKKSSEEKQKNVREAKEAYLQSHCVKNIRQGERYVLVDGYNVIFAWEELKELSKISLDAARGRLLDILCNYQGFTKCILIVVFDAYKVKGNLGEVAMYHNIHVVYTKEAETADMYIEKVTRKIGKKEHVTVITSDGMEQMIVAGHGAFRRSAREFKEEVGQIKKQIREEFL